MVLFFYTADEDLNFKTKDGTFLTQHPISLQNINLLFFRRELQHRNLNYFSIEAPGTSSMSVPYRTSLPRC